MLWQEILIDRHVTDAELVRGLAATFDISASVVQLIPDITDLDESIGADVRLVGEVTPVKGDFRLSVAIYLRDRDVQQHVINGDAREFVRQLCRAWNCRALMDDGSDDPYSWLLIDPVTAAAPVEIDSNRVDDDVYVLNQHSRKRVHV